MKLELLWLHRTAIKDVTPLAGLAALTRLSLAQTAVTDRAPLAGLARLDRAKLDTVPPDAWAPPAPAAP